MKFRSAVLVLLSVCVSLPGSASGASKLAGHCGFGYNKSVNEGAPDGAFGMLGGILLQAQPDFGVGLEVGYLGMGTYTTALLGSSGSVTESASVTHIPITAGVEYSLQTDGKVHPLLVGGVGLYIAKIESDVTVFNDQASVTLRDSTTETDPGFNVGTGLKLGRPSQTVRFGGDARFHLVFSEGESTRMVNVMGHLYFD